MSSESCVPLPASTPLVTTAETAVITGPVIPENNPTGQGVRISGYLNVTAGAGTTGVTIRVRLGSGLTGATIGGAPLHSLGAGNVASIPFEAIDSTLVNPAFGQPGGTQYTVTVQQTGATGNGTVNNGTLGQTPISAFNG